MHDPYTVAHQIKSPFRGKPSKIWPKGYRETLVTIWHKDPCRAGFGGSDDTCGWFMRAHHGDKEVLARIVKRFEEDWDRVFKTKKEDHDDDDGPFIEHAYYRGLFKPNGDPHLSVSAIVLNLFFMAAMEYFGVDGSTNWMKARRWVQANLFDILHFAENPADSLFDTITRKFEKGCGEEYGDRARLIRIQSLASCIYGWILRRERKWWRHPRWHIHHWRIQIHAWQSFKRRFFDRCSVCGKGFKSKESVCGDWSGKRIWHDRCSAVDTKQPTPKC